MRIQYVGLLQLLGLPLSFLLLGEDTVKPLSVNLTFTCTLRPSRLLVLMDRLPLHFKQTAMFDSKVSNFFMLIISLQLLSSWLSFNWVYLNTYTQLHISITTRPRLRWTHLIRKCLTFFDTWPIIYFVFLPYRYTI